MFRSVSYPRDFTLNVIDHSDPVTAGVGHFMVTGELYFPKTDPSRSKLLLTAYDVEHDATYPSRSPNIDFAWPFSYRAG